MIINIIITELVSQLNRINVNTITKYGFNFSHVNIVNAIICKYISKNKTCKAPKLIVLI